MSSIPFIIISLLSTSNRFKPYYNWNAFNTKKDILKITLNNVF